MNLDTSYFKKALTYCLSYLKENIGTKFKSALHNAAKAFKEVLWNELKTDVYNQAILALQAAEAYYKTEQVKIKKEKLIIHILDKVKLPFFLKPFKGLLKNLIISKIEEIFNEGIHKGYEFLNA